MSVTLYDLIPRDHASNDILLERFLEYVDARRLQLYPTQESAVLELFEEKNVILNTPTGSVTALRVGPEESVGRQQVSEFLVSLEGSYTSFTYGAEPSGHFREWVTAPIRRAEFVINT